MQRIPSIETLAAGLIDTGSCEARRRQLRSPMQAAAKADAAACVDVSVVTVCFNPLKEGRKEVFQKNLDSVQAQTGVRLEHLVIDGASTDGTVEWLKAYRAEHHDLRILSLPDSGIYEAMNRGIALARGKYVIFLNSDDYFHNPRGMAASLAKIEAMQCDFTFAPVRFSPSGIHRHAQLYPHRRLYRFLITWSFSHQSMLTSRAMLLKLDGFDTTYRSAADYDLLLRMIVDGAKGCFVPCTFTTFRLGGFSADNKQLALKECARSLQIFYREFYATEMTNDEVAYIIKHHAYPRKYLNIFKQSQQLIRERFIGIPGGPIAWLSRWFNYIKYYHKCLNSNV